MTTRGTDVPVVQQFWVVPNHSRRDYLQVFVEPSQWPIGLAHTSYLQLSINAFDRYLTNTQQKQVIEFCKRNNIKLSISFKFVPGYLTGRRHAGIEGTLS